MGCERYWISNHDTCLPPFALEVLRPKTFVYYQWNSYAGGACKRGIAHQPFPSKGLAKGPQWCSHVPQQQNWPEHDDEVGRSFKLLQDLAVKLIRSVESGIVS